MPAVSIWGRLKGHAPEKIDSASSSREAAYLAGEYQLAFGRDWVVWCGRKDQEPNGVSHARQRM